MARIPVSSARERILDAAADLFDRYGVHAVGMQRIIDEAGCGKNLLYREFSSKDELVVAYLRRAARGWDITLEAARATVATPQRQLVELVRVVGERVPGTRGCPLRNTYAEFPDRDHPAHQVALEHFGAVREQLCELARQTSAPAPERLADRILLIINGLYINASGVGAEESAAIAVQLAQDVVRGETAAKASRSGVS
ncbi:TetR/AcrR family transcriptional regulator [Streptomyces radicis]|uniref:TetR/AcrR family transcriptional regulator n=1 Tax=Streptomyces radicis TaxID=1750517 RepID=A0A3A9WCA9_9ACTN|nr:TetR/AcrR family transcriptional regulator [Streptomyces radicis]RKN10991.1 TetR/AcrR family transcriptional regulator [Streptomyces radicis]RKN25254.1 TetR/AcrR family transcriptional regulator [Streptomyces radicis]